jgi:hypothetical protein
LNISAQHTSNATSSLQDDLLIDSTETNAVPLYLDRDIPHMLERFIYQMEAHEGFVKHCLKREELNISFRPGEAAKPVWNRVERNSRTMQKRLQRLREKVKSISTTVLTLFVLPCAVQLVANVAHTDA